MNSLPYQPSSHECHNDQNNISTHQYQLLFEELQSKKSMLNQIILQHGHIQNIKAQRNHIEQSILIAFNLLEDQCEEISSSTKQIQSLSQQQTQGLSQQQTQSLSQQQTQGLSALQLTLDNLRSDIYELEMQKIKAQKEMDDILGYERQKLSDSSVLESYERSYEEILKDIKNLIQQTKAIEIDVEGMQGQISRWKGIIKIVKSKQSLQSNLRCEMDEINYIQRKISKELQILEEEENILKGKIIIQHNKIIESHDQNKCLVKEKEVLLKHCSDLHKRIHALKVKQEELTSTREKFHSIDVKKEIANLFHSNTLLSEERYTRQLQLEESTRVKESSHRKEYFQELHHTFHALKEFIKEHKAEEKNHPQLIQQNSTLKARIIHLKTLDSQFIHQKTLSLQQLKDKVQILHQQKQSFQQLIQDKEIQLAAFKNWQNQYKSTHIEGTEEVDVKDKKCKKKKNKNQLNEKHQNHQKHQKQEKRQRHDKNEKKTKQKEEKIEMNLTDSSNKNEIKNESSKEIQTKIQISSFILTIIGICILFAFFILILM